MNYKYVKINGKSVKYKVLGLYLILVDGETVVTINDQPLMATPVNQTSGTKVVAMYYLNVCDTEAALAFIGDNAAVRIDRIY